MYDARGREMKVTFKVRCSRRHTHDAMFYRSGRSMTKFVTLMQNTCISNVKTFGLISKFFKGFYLSHYLMFSENHANHTFLLFYLMLTVVLQT